MAGDATFDSPMQVSVLPGRAAIVLTGPSGERIVLTRDAAAKTAQRLLSLLALCLVRNDGDAEELRSTGPGHRLALALRTRFARVRPGARFLVSVVLTPVAIAAIFYLGATVAALFLGRIPDRATLLALLAVAIAGAPVATYLLSPLLIDRVRGGMAGRRQRPRPRLRLVGGSAA